MSEFMVKDESLKEWCRYEDLRIGDNIGIAALGKMYYFRIVNIEDVPFIYKTSSNWALASGNIFNVGTISDFLEPAGGTLYVLKCGMYSDRENHLLVRMQGTTGELYGISNYPRGGRITPTISPYRNPRIVLKSWTDQYVPSFTLENRTRMYSRLTKLSFIGLKWGIEAIGAKPPVFTPISLIHVGEGGASKFAEAVSPERVVPSAIPVEFESVTYSGGGY